MQEYAFLTRSADIENYINRELQSIGFPSLDLSNTQSTLGTLFSLLKQRQVVEFHVARFVISTRPSGAIEVYGSGSFAIGRATRIP
jgi:hypothetical protein